ncbi:MAG: RagB/SusD family nutrient uptake outer membrane protein [Bacteroidales bacterium]|nr:RagB/SusD family nutrient uptake outer membrane protein [Bacteroidales bacterium]MBQ6822204.1 RagB/SusD family nutrient uptake outer membrane protein [Bacteroidales bacterium]MBR0291379.1 RagB/SusD family nutrient uptake outer membrane protein [Bacteroidales bacterium]
MKKYIFTALAAAALMTACVDLDLSPKSQGSSENWYSTAQELELSLNALYSPSMWFTEAWRLWPTDRWTDDWNQRTQSYDWLAGSISTTWSEGAKHWAAYYKGIARANTIIESVENAKENLSEEQIRQYTGEAKFFRASFYTYLIFLYGDVPYYDKYMTLEQAYEMGRKDRNYILERIYEDFDAAADALPTSYAKAQRVTKGAALAMKARAALFMNDWATCAAAAKACMDLGVYSLHEDYRELFLSKTKTSPEVIFALPASNELGIHSYDEAATRSFYPRNNGGTSVAQPTWQLFFAYTCTDGKNVEDSPLYDPAHPFANRDPRLSEVIVPFDSEFMDYIYNPRPSATQTLQVSTGKMVKNNDTKPVSKDCSYNGLVLKKGIDEEWIDDRLTDSPMRIIRYGDVLLMYAESKMELGQIDADLFKAVNSVRARAYKCGVGETGKYPAITETNQTALRRILRNERRCELAWENRRWFDVMRWKMAEECFTMPIYGLPGNEQSAENEKTGYWPWPKDFRPHMKASSAIDISDIENYPKYFTINQRGAFVAREYLFPIPENERVVCPNLTQNPGY